MGQCIDCGQNIVGTGRCETCDKEARFGVVSDERIAEFREDADD